MRNIKIDRNLEPHLLKLPNNVLIPTPEFIIATHDVILKFRKEIGRSDQSQGIRDKGLIIHLCDQLMDRKHKYGNNLLENIFMYLQKCFSILLLNILLSMETKAQPIYMP